MSDNANWNIDFGCVGPYAHFHHQCFQMVDLMMLHCKRAMNELNPHAFPHEPTEHNTNHTDENNMPSKDEKVEQQSRF